MPPYTYKYSIKNIFVKTRVKICKMAFLLIKLKIMYKTLRKLWKAFWTPILSNSILQWLIVSILAALTWFIFLTSRHKFTNTKSLRNYRKKPVVFVFFHGRCAMLSPVIKSARVKAYCVASRHKDGRIMARLQRLFGMRAIYG